MTITKTKLSKKNLKSQTDWARLDRASDKEIVYDADVPKLTANEMKSFRRIKQPKTDIEITVAESTETYYVKK